MASGKPAYVAVGVFNTQEVIRPVVTALGH